MQMVSFQTTARFLKGNMIELRVEDTSGKVTKDRVVVTVGAANEVPDCEIVAPEDSTTSILGEALILRGFGIGC